MPINEGLLRELEVINEIDGKKINELSNNCRTLVKNLFGVLSDDKVVHCEKIEGNNKADFFIEYDDKRRYVSMKSGAAVIVHNEIIDNFISYLREEGISEETIETILLFHYGDGSTDGSGEIRKNTSELMYVMKDRIKKANGELNWNMEFIVKTVKRLMFYGASSDYIPADALYFGDKDYGVVVTMKQVIRHLQKRGFDFYDNLHIGPLLIRPDARYVTKEIVSQRKYNRIVAYWPNLQADVIFISKRYNYDYMY